MLILRFPTILKPINYGPWHKTSYYTTVSYESKIYSQSVAIHKRRNEFGLTAISADGTSIVMSSTRNKYIYGKLIALILLHLSKNFHTIMFPPDPTPTPTPTYVETPTPTETPILQPTPTPTPTDGGSGVKVEVRAPREDSEFTLNTTKVTDMQYMFNGCSSLVKLHPTNWNTSSVKEYGLYVQ